MHFRRLWNGMFGRHQAEITVMQFRGHSLPVHQFVTVSWDFNPVPYCQPSSPAPMEYALLPLLEWHVWRGRRSIYNTQFECLTVLFDPSIGPYHAFPHRARMDLWARSMKGYFIFLQSVGASPWDCLMLFAGHAFGGKSYLSAELQWMYSTAPADWAVLILNPVNVLYILVYRAILTLEGYTILDLRTLLGETVGQS